MTTVHPTDELDTEVDSCRDQRRPTRTQALAAKAAGLVLVIAASTLGFIGSAPSASAWAWDPSVTLQGRAIACSSNATWVWVQASNGEAGWATQSGGNYRFNFRRVPTSGMSVTVRFGNNLCSRSTSFGLNRPAIGTTATRNVITIY